MINDTLMRTLAVLKARRMLTRALILAIFSLVMNAIIMYLVRRYRPGGRGSRVLHTSRNGSNRRKHGSKKQELTRVKKSVPNLLLLLGIPGSGKTTWLEQYLQRCDYSYVVVNAATAEAKLKTETHDVPGALDIREVMISDILQHLSEKRDVVVDSVYVMEEGFRRRIMNAAPPCNWLVKEFPIKALFAHARLLKGVEDATACHCLSEAELEEMESTFFLAQAHMKEEGWRQLLDLSRHRSRHL